MSKPVQCGAFFLLLMGHPSVAMAQKMTATDSLLTVLKTMPSDSEKVGTLKKLFNIYRNSNNEKALATAEEEISLSKKIKYLKGEATGYRHKGVVYHVMGDYTKAFENYLLALRIYKKNGNEYFVAACYSNMADLYLKQDNIPEAINYTHTAIKIWKHINDNCKDGLAMALNNLGEIYTKQGNEAKALANYNESLAIATEENYKDLVAMVSLNLARLYYNRKEYALSSDYLEKSYTVALEIDNQWVVADNLCLRSQVYKANKQYAKAMKTAKQSLEVAQKLETKDLVVNAYKELAEVSAMVGQYKSAFEYQSQYMGIEKSLENNRSVRETEKLQYDYQLEKKELQNKLLNEEKALYKSQIRNDKARKIVGGIFVLLLMVVIAVYFINFEKQKKISQLLVEQKEEITSQKEAILRQHLLLTKQSDELTKANHALTKLFNIISHDLRAPLSNVIGFVSIIDVMVQTPELLTKFSKDLLGSVNGAVDLLDNLLNWSRTQISGMNANPMSFDICEVIAKNVVVLSPVAGSKNIAIENSCVAGQYAMADPDMISVVVRNLISNAIKFSHAGEMISIQVDLQQDNIQIAIKDTGIGMSQTLKEKIFDATSFYSSIGTQKERGTGLGMKFCMEAIAMNNGKIWVESEEGKGSIFYFTIPRDLGD